MKTGFRIILLVFFLIVLTINVKASVVWDGKTTCTNNWAGGACRGSITYTSSTTLTNDVNASTDIIINSGITLTTAGWSIFTGNMFKNSGTVVTSTNFAGGSGGAGGLSPTAGGAGTGNTISYSGSGAGGGGGGGGTDAAGGAGGATRNAGGAGDTGTGAGAGTLPSPPTLTNSQIQQWYANSIGNYLTGASGGGGGGGTRSSGGGGGGGGGKSAYGLYIQANNLIAGTINANAFWGSSGVAGSGVTVCDGGGGGGGGGGGLVIFAYNSLYTAGTYNVLAGAGGTGGGAGGCGVGIAGDAGATGGSGNTMTFAYTSPPLRTVPVATTSGNIVANPNPPQESNTIIDVGQYSTINTILTGGNGAPYKGNWIWSAPNTLGTGATSNTILANILNGALINQLITINALTTTNIIFTFNGVNYPIPIAASNTAFGSWSFTANAFDAGFGNYIATSSNSVTINPQLLALPANIQYYIPLTIQNFQGGSTGTNFQQVVTANSLKYQTYEASSLQNVEFFYQNGTVIKSWIESNAINTAVQTNYWLNLTAGIGPAANIIIYMGFSPTSNSLLDGVNVGEASMLSSTFGQYDNGKKIFLFYNNSNALMPSNNIGTGGTQSVVTTAPSPYANAIKGTTSGAGSAATTWTTSGINSIVLPANYIAQTLVYLGAGITDLLTNVNTITAGNFYMFRLDGRSYVAGAQADLIGNYPSGAISVLTLSYATTNTLPGSWYQLTAQDVNDKLSLYKASAFNLNSLGTAELSSITGSGYIGNGIAISTDGDGSTDYWALTLVRNYPPSGAMPSVNTGSVTPAITPQSAVTLDAGQSITIGANTAGGTSAYTYNYIVVNTVTGSQVANQLYTSVASTSNTYTFISTSSMAGNIVYANAIISDGATTPAKINTTESAKITINSALAPSITVSNTVLDQGQYTTITASAGGGTAPYTYNILVYNTISNIIVANQLGSGTTYSPQSNSFWTSNSPLSINVIVTDTGSTTSFTTNSANTLIKVATALSAPTISVTNTILDSGQYTTLTATASGGSTPYSYNFLVYNTISNTIVANLLTTSTSATFQSNGFWVSNSPLSTNVVVTDGATTNAIANSVNTIIKASTAPTVTISVTNTILNSGQYTTITGSVSNGVGPFTYNFVVYNTVSNTIVANQLGSSSTFTTQSNSFWLSNSPLSTNVFITDTGTTTPFTTNSANTILNVKTLLTASVTGTTGSVGFYTIVTLTFNGLPSVNNQTFWSLFVNGGLFGKTNSIITWSEQAMPGTYNFNFSNPGNANYTSNSITATLVVSGQGTGGGVTTTIPTTSTTSTIIPNVTTTTATSTTSTTTISPQNQSVVNVAVSSNITAQKNLLYLLVLSPTRTATYLVSIKNVTGSVPSPPAGYIIIYALNISVNSTIPTLNIASKYPCSIASYAVQPFLLKNGTWKSVNQIIVDASSCTVTFPVSSSDPIIAIMQNLNPQTTSTSPTTILQAQPGLGPSTLLPVIIAVIAIVLIVAYYMLARKKRAGSK